MAPNRCIDAESRSSPELRRPGVIRAPAVDSSIRSSFNPRPALAGRASSSTRSNSKPFACFNPRPALAGRASIHDSAPKYIDLSFNPRPALAGRASAFRHQSSNVRLVSILARPSPPPMSPNGFQSSPGPRGPGVPHDTPYLRRTQVVSILARPSRAGRLRQHGGRERTDSCFNPRPALAGRASGRPGRNDCALPVSILARPSRAGRPCRSGRCRLEGCFNPRPALAGRASNLPWLRIYEQSVSILARPSRAGRLTAPARAAEQDEFQSSPGPRGPGVPNPARSPAPRWGFNPRPALAGRASRTVTRLSRSSCCFNPRPALAGRASLVHFMCDSGGHVSILARPSRAGRPVKVVPSSRR